jgi:hypothetical protein
VTGEDDRETSLLVGPLSRGFGLVISRSSPQVGYMLLGFVIALGLFFGYLLFQCPFMRMTSKKRLN